jgi:hypothetical protein
LVLRFARAPRKPGRTALTAAQWQAERRIGKEKSPEMVPNGHGSNENELRA